MLKWFATFIAIGGSGALWAACDPSVPVKRRIVISWDGQTDARFTQALNASMTGLARGAGRQFVMADRALVGPVGDRPQGLASSGADSVQYLPATGDSLKKIQDKINFDFEATKRLEGKNFNPLSYEIVFFMTNHGSITATKNGVRYGLTTDARESSSLPVDQLGAFAAGLPQGIRRKRIFAPCFSQDMQSAMESGEERDQAQGCSCGVARAEPGFPSWSTLADNIKTWEGRIAELSSTRDISLAEANWASIGQEFGRFRQEGKDDALNANLLSSESLVNQVLMGRPSVRRLLPTPTSDELEKKATVVLKQIGGDKALGGITLANRQLLGQSDMARARAIYELLGLRAGDAGASAAIARIADTTSLEFSAYDPKERRLAYERENTAAYEALNARNTQIQKEREERSAIFLKKIDRIRQKLNGPLLPPAELQALADEGNRLNAAFKVQERKSDEAVAEITKQYDQFFARKLPDHNDHSKEGAAKLVARQRLEKAFLLSATEAQKKQFFNLRACELEQLGPGPQKTAYDAPRADKTTEHRI